MRSALGRASILSLVAIEALGAQTSAGSKYLFVWTGDGARKASDFLAVLDADPTSQAYGHVVASAPVGATGTMPHHTEYEFPADGMLLANGWAASRTYVFDLRSPTAPKVATSFGAVGPYAFPHSFARLPNGHLLGTFQGAGTAYAPPGGLVEIDERGTLVRSASAVHRPLADTLTWPYSLAVDAAHDRVIVTNTTMGIPKWLVAPAGSWRKARVDSVITSQVQIWSLSKLVPMQTIALPRPANANAKFPPNELAAEPRVLPDGSVYVNTFNCGLYHLSGLETGSPRVALVQTFPIRDGKFCAVPAIIGHYWIQSVPAIPGLVTLDIRDPSKPKEVSRLVLAAPNDMPHWLAADAKGHRVVVTGDDMGFVAIVNVDPRTGALSLDKNFKDERTGVPGVSLDGRTWPHGAVQRAFVHGTLFGPR